MSYLVTQMFLYLLVAFLLGLILGWLIWRYGKEAGEDAGALRRQCDSLKAENQELKAKLSTCQNSLAAKSVAPVATMAAAPVAAAATAAPVAGTKPQGLSAPRGGKADDLKQISGVGPKMEKLVNSLGFYHFDQIAGWSASEVAWVDDNLEGFKGRVTRDNWIDQAKVLAHA